MSDLDDFMKQVGAPANLGAGGAGAPVAASAAAAPSSSASSEGGGRDVVRGLAKSGAGTLVAIPRLANQAIGLFSPSTSTKLGDLAEQVPGVKRLEGFADSPNETTAESMGYWGGEIGQAFLPTEWLKGLQYGAKGAETVIDATEMFKAGRGASKAAGAATKAAAAAPEAGEFVSTGNKAFDDMIKATRAERRAGEAETGQGMGASARALRAQRASSEAAPLRFLEDPPPVRSPARGALPRAARAGVVGGLQGAVGNPQDPMSGFIGGAATGGLAPLAGEAMRSPVGQWMAGHGARSSAATAALAIASHLGIPGYVLWGLSLPQLIRFWHSPFARRLDALARRGAVAGGGALARSTGRVAGAAGGAATQSINDTGWMPQPPATQERPDDQGSSEPQAQTD